MPFTKKRIAHINRTIHNKDQRNDIWYTPKALSRTAIRMVPLMHSDGAWLDPCRGKGSYYDQFPPMCTKDYCEISENKDFFKYDKKVDVVISNPPYSRIDDWLEQSVKLEPSVINYLIGINNFTTRRLEYMNDKGYGLTKLHFCKVKAWFGMSVIVQFEKDKTNIVTFDRTIWHSDKSDEKDGNDLIVNTDIESQLE